MGKLGWTLAAAWLWGGLALGAERWSPPDEAALEVVARAVRDQPIDRRMAALSAVFVGAPYQVSPLGEGAGKDRDPLYRFDAVDCLTFVEQVIALGVADHPRAFSRVLASLRYRAEVSYAGRNHLMEAQWLPSAIAKGFLIDVTDRYGGRSVESAAHALDQTSWSSPSSQALDLPREAQPRGMFTFRLLPLVQVPKVARAIPTGTVIVVVRESRPVKATRVTHLGFVVQKKRLTYLRHASRASGRVVDEDLGTFLARHQKYGKWKVSGVSLYEVRAPGGKAATAAASP